MKYLKPTELKNYLGKKIRVVTRPEKIIPNQNQVGQLEGLTMESITPVVILKEYKRGKGITVLYKKNLRLISCPYYVILC